jgi:hypothetical protein
VDPADARTAPSTLSEVMNYLAASWPGVRAVAMTSAATGLPALAALDLGLIASFESLRYQTMPGQAPHGVMLPAEDDVLAGLARRAHSIDLVMIDPFHTYEASRRAIAAALDAAADDSLVLVHDCFPPLALRSPHYHPGSWCGVTYLAFLDACIDGDRDWFTIDSDFGIGVLGPAGSRTRRAPRASSELVSRWQSAGSDDDRDRLVESDGADLWNLIPPEHALVLLDDFLDLVLGSRRHHGAPTTGSEVDTLRRAVLDRDLELVEVRRAWEDCRADLDTTRRVADLVPGLRADLAVAQQQRDSLRRSPSMRVGRSLTAVPRILRDAVRPQHQKPS